MGCGLCVLVKGLVVVDWLSDTGGLILRGICRVCVVCCTSGWRGWCRTRDRPCCFTSWLFWSLEPLVRAQRYIDGVPCMSLVSPCPSSPSPQLGTSVVVIDGVSVCFALVSHGRLVDGAVVSCWVSVAVPAVWPSERQLPRAFNR